MKVADILTEDCFQTPLTRGVYDAIKEIDWTEYLSNETTFAVDSVVFSNEFPHGYVAGARTVYTDSESEIVAKNLTELQSGDQITFLCDYYSYDGEYQDSYKMGEDITVNGDLTVSDVELDYTKLQITYRFTDIYDAHHWAEIIDLK